MQRLLLFSSHEGEQVLAQCTVLVRTPQLHLCPAVHARERDKRTSIQASAQRSQVYDSGTENSVSSASHSRSTEKLVDVDERQKAWKCWIRRCRCRREKQVQHPQEFITLLEKVLCQAHLTLEAQRDLSRCAHTNENRAETHEAYRRYIPNVKEYRLNIKKFGITKNYEQMKQPEDTRQPSQDSLKRNFIRKSTGIRYYLEQDPRCICRR